MKTAGVYELFGQPSYIEKLNCDTSLMPKLRNSWRDIYAFYPRATRCGGDIVTLLWFRACDCVCVRASGHGPCEHDRDWTVACFFVKLGRHINHDERMNPIDFGGQRSKVKVTMDIYGNKLVNMIETKPLCIFLSNMADMLTMVRGWTLLILEVRGQRSRSQWTYMEMSLWTR